MQSLFITAFEEPLSLKSPEGVHRPGQTSLKLSFFAVAGPRDSPTPHTLHTHSTPPTHTPLGNCHRLFRLLGFSPFRMGSGKMVSLHPPSFAVPESRFVDPLHCKTWMSIITRENKTKSRLKGEKHGKVRYKGTHLTVLHLGLEHLTIGLK